jgi:hypothetical protein
MTIECSIEHCPEYIERLEKKWYLREIVSIEIIEMTWE